MGKRRAGSAKVATVEPPATRRRTASAISGTPTTTTSAPNVVAPARGRKTAKSGGQQPQSSPIVSPVTISLSEGQLAAIAVQVATILRSSEGAVPHVVTQTVDPPQPVAPVVETPPSALAGPSLPSVGQKEAPTSINKTVSALVVKSVVDELMGECSPPSSQVPCRATSSDSAPLDFEVPEKCIQAIQSDKFVELKHLLADDGDEEESVIKNLDNEGTFRVVNSRKQKPITTIGQWIAAFTIFIDIYTSKFPQQKSPLLKYMQTIMKLADGHQGMVWHTYDVKFRKLRQKQRQPWDKVNNEFLLDLTVVKPSQAVCGYESKDSSNQPFRQKSYKNQGPFIKSTFPKGFCWNFQQHGECNEGDCPFKHQCYSCAGAHAANKCPKKH